MRIVLTLWVFLFMLSLTKGQEKKFATHTVAKGETLYSIAKKYLVTPFQIMLENPELKKPEDLKPNDLLAIPLHYAGSNLDVSNTSFTNTKNQRLATYTSPSEKEPQPIGFINHQVKKKETLFGLSQKYNLPQEIIKKYNTALYSQGLKRGMSVLIPKFTSNPILIPPSPVVIQDTTETEEQELDFMEYKVGEKETRWSIANKFRITIGQLLALNPNLDPNNDYLPLGIKLQVPRPKGNSLPNQEVIIFESYTVPKSLGLFRLSQDFGIPVDSIMNLNPEIQANNGLKEGMVLRLPRKKANPNAINTDNFIFYTVKQKETIYNLTTTLEISRDSLYLLNPNLEEGLKAGMILKIPKKTKGNLVVKNSLVVKGFDLLDSINPKQIPSIVFMLPFRINALNFEETEQTEYQVGARKDINYAAGFYSGALMAIDSINQLGISVNVKTIDTERNLTKVNKALGDMQWSEIDVIIGPLDPNLITPIATMANNYEIPVVLPFNSDYKTKQPNMFFSMPTSELLRNRLLDSVSHYYKNQNLIIISDKNSVTAKETIIKKFPKSRVAQMAGDGSLHLENFQAMLSSKEDNWVFVETDDANLINSISSILNASNGREQADGKKIIVKMFTTSYNEAFEASDVEPVHLSNLNFTFCAAEKTPNQGAFLKAYESKFGHPPDRIAIRGFDLTLDILLKLAYNKNLSKAATAIGVMEHLGNKFDYYPNWPFGYTNCSSYLMQYDNLKLVERK